MEKKRRARINESLQELRTLLADTDVSTERAYRPPHSSLCSVTQYRRELLQVELIWLFSQFHSKMENAEVLELTVKKVEDILKNRKQGVPKCIQPV